MALDTSLQLTPAQLSNYQSPEGKELIARKVLGALRSVEVPRSFQDMSLRIYFAPLMGDNQEQALLLLRFDKKNTIAVVYRKNEENYALFSYVGRFYDIVKTDFVFIGALNRNIIVFEEKINNCLGAYEKITYLKGYLWNGFDFPLVLNKAIYIKAYWNTAWDSNSNSKYWNRVTQDTSTEWKILEYPDLYLYTTQEYSTYTKSETVNLPPDNEFSTLNSRFLVEQYYWNADWNKFILYEAVYKKTGETVAVIENIGNTSYALVDSYFQRCVVYRKNGETIIVPNSELDLLNKEERKV